MVARIPEPRTLSGTHITLSPMSEGDLPELYPVIARPEVFAGGYGGGPAGVPHSYAEFVDFARRYYDRDRRRVFTIRLAAGPDAGAIVGTTTLGDFEPEREACHIGWTAYDRRLWGTVVNAEAKFLLLSLAFDQGFGRVKIQADERNAHSRAAISKLGASFEGLVRRDVRRADGSWRTTAVYSILGEEWEGVAARLRARIDAAVTPVQLSA